MIDVLIIRITDYMAKLKNINLIPFKFTGLAEEFRIFRKTLLLMKKKAHTKKKKISMYSIWK